MPQSKIELMQCYCAKHSDYLYVCQRLATRCSLSKASLPIIFFSPTGTVGLKSIRLLIHQTLGFSSSISEHIAIRSKNQHQMAAERIFPCPMIKDLSPPGGRLQNPRNGIMALFSGFDDSPFVDLKNLMVFPLETTHFSSWKMPDFPAIQRPLDER